MCPLYDYECSECKSTQEVLHPMSGPNFELKCEKCGSKKMEKQLSTFYAKFEGPGWDTNNNRHIAN